ncbi:MAG: phosphotransferase [Patescibacteria group bacterium]|jgi:aminoglycoside phosphotransferase
MNKILHLLDQRFVLDLFTKEVLPLYPEFKKIDSIKITPIKKNVWETTYHVVVKYSIKLLKNRGRDLTLTVYCSAHSNEPRKNSFEALNYLWNKGFGHDHLTIPRPLFFSDFFNGYFYRGVHGNNLYHYICNKNYVEIEKIVLKAAAWFAKLHKLPVEKAKNFNEQNSRIKTVIPGYDFILKKLWINYPDYYQSYKQAFELISAKEEKFLKNPKNRWLIHGDAHPENVIKISQKTIAVIDFTDICLADFARDLGTFLQQFEYMFIQQNNDKNYVKKIQNLFLNNYLKLTNIKLNDSLKERINYYYCWTALRTASLFFIKEQPEPELAQKLLIQVHKKLNLN